MRPMIMASLIWIPIFTKLRFIFETTKNAEKKHIFAITENLKIIMDTSVTIHNISEYDEILRQAVAVIDGYTKLIIPRDELKQLITDEIRTFNTENI